jgi:hypothetical protein
MSHSRKVAEINANEIMVQFSPAVTKAFGDLEEAVRGSEHFDWDAHKIVKDYAAGKPKTLHSALIGLPSVAMATMEYVRMTGDRSAEMAWQDIAGQINENGFSLTQERGRRK